VDIRIDKNSMSPAIYYARKFAWITSASLIGILKTMSKSEMSNVIHTDKTQTLNV